MIYATEGFYKGNYLLDRKPVISAGFSFYAREASNVIDRYTFSRLKSMAEIPEEIQMCCCELAEHYFTAEKMKKESSGKASEKVGTYSVTYAATNEIKKLEAAEEHDIIMKWLADTGLCYQGV